MRWLAVLLGSCDQGEEVEDRKEVSRYKLIPLYMSSLQFRISAKEKMGEEEVQLVTYLLVASRKTGIINYHQRVKAMPS